MQPYAAEHSHAASESDVSSIDSVQTAQTPHQSGSLAAAHDAACEPGRQIKNYDCAPVQGINSDLSELLSVCDRSSGVLFCDQTHEL
jgi:hypothetical protein